MASDNIMTLSSQNFEQLKHLADVLHLFYHRNKNQHRRSLWWRHFSTFRRQVNTLFNEYQKLSETAATHLEKIQKKTRDKDTESKISGRLLFWRDVMVPKWQHAFSQVVADGRFATLGLLLIASLSQSCQLVGITAAFEDLGQTEIEKAIHEFGEEYWEALEASKGTPHGDSEDVGEVVARDSVPSLEASGKDSAPDGAPASVAIKSSKHPRKHKESESVSATTSADDKPTKPARKKRKKGNAIDDLFSSLG